MSPSAQQWSTTCALTRVLLVVLGALVAGCAKSDERWLAELADPDPFVRAMAALALCEQAPERASAAVPVLLETVDRAELGMQSQARAALVHIGPRAGEILRASLAADEFMTVDRRQAIEAALGAR